MEHKKNNSTDDNQIDDPEFEEFIEGIRANAKNKPPMYFHEGQLYTKEEMLAIEREEMLALQSWKEMEIEQDFLDDIVIKIRMEDGSLMETYMSTTDYKC